MIAVTQIFVRHTCFEVFWSKMAEKGTLWAIAKSPRLERVCVCLCEGAFFGSLSEEPLPKGGELEKGLLAPPPPRQKCGGIGWPCLDKPMLGPGLGGGVHTGV